jgi:hypothetical protein
MVETVWLILQRDCVEEERSGLGRDPDRGGSWPQPALHKNRNPLNGSLGIVQVQSIYLRLANVTRSMQALLLVERT